MIKETMEKVLLAAGLIAAGAANAAWTVDADGTGFVGKGDVQFVYNWNNPALQANANKVMFRALTGEITDFEWTCTRDAGTQTQERARSTTLEVSGILSSVARERNQLTGFILDGWDGTAQQTTTSDGPALLSCPTGWSPSGLSENSYPLRDSGVQVSIDGIIWLHLPAGA